MNLALLGNVLRLVVLRHGIQCRAVDGFLYLLEGHNLHTIVVVRLGEVVHRGVDACADEVVLAAVVVQLQAVVVVVAGCLEVVEQQRLTAKQIVGPSHAVHIRYDRCTEVGYHFAPQLLVALRHVLSAQREDRLGVRGVEGVRGVVGHQVFLIDIEDGPCLLG